MSGALASARKGRPSRIPLFEHCTVADRDESQYLLVTRAEGLLKNLKGTNSIAFTKTDPVALAKILTKVAKDVPAFQFRAGFVEGRVISIQEITQLALLPSKEELISKIMFMLNSPAQRLATVNNAVMRNLAVVVSEAVKAEKFAAPAA